MSLATIKLHREAVGSGRFWRSAGMAGVAFFFLKGLFWLLLPLAWYVTK